MVVKNNIYENCILIRKNIYGIVLSIKSRLYYVVIVIGYNYVNYCELGRLSILVCYWFFGF